MTHEARRDVTDRLVEGYYRLSAERALLLSMLLVTHWLSALVLTPVLFAVFRLQFARGSIPRNSPRPR